MNRTERTETALHLLALLAAVGLQVLMLAPLFGPGEPLGDDMSIHYAEIAHLGPALAAGDLDLWNPGGNLGFASGYYYQILPQLVTALVALALRGLADPLSVFKASIALPLLLFPLAVYRAVRLAGAPPAHAVAAAAGASLVSGESGWGFGVDSLFTTGVFTQAWAMVFFPLAVAHGGRYLVAGRGLRPAVLWGLLAGLSHPFIGVAIAPALLVLPWWRAGARTALRRAALLGALLLAASAFLWLPILVHHDSFGGFPVRVAGEEGIPIGELVSRLCSGRLLDYRHAALGLPFSFVTILLLPALLLALLGPSPLRLVLAEGALFGLLVVLGPAAGKIEGNLLPAVRFLAPMQIALGAASGIALARIAAAAISFLRLDEGRTARSRLSLFGVALGVVRPRLAPGSRTARTALAIGAGAAALAFGAAAVAGSVNAGHARVRTVVSLPEIARDELGEVLHFLRGRPRGRVFAAAEIGTGSHWWMYLPFAVSEQPPVRVYGGAALQSSPNFRYLRDSLPAGRLRLFGVRHVLARRPPPQIPDGRVVFETPRFAVIEIAGASLFSPIEIAGPLEGERAAAIDAWLSGPEPDRGRHLLREGSPAAAGKPPAGGGLREWEGFSRCGAEVESGGAGPTTFLLRVTYHPGWEAAIDGKPAAILRVSPDVMAVDVPPGKHEIAFRFRRPAWTWALLIGTVAALLAAAGRGAARRRRGMCLRALA